MKIFGEIHHKQLANGLQIIVNQDSTVPKVSLQLWYRVGSKDERSGQRGLAHLLEHMIFKGTRRLSESDINEITQKLSGYTNAFTSYDYTGYMFDFPKQHWRTALDLFSDCMINCRFDEDMLQSELKAVVQELKLYKDNYGSVVAESMLANMFPDHPYHHSVIGYKQDLWSITRDALLQFYKEHYTPNNATLVVVGDVSPEEVYKEVEHYFGALVAQPQHKAQHYAATSMFSTSVTLYRDVQRSQLVYAWRIPGFASGIDYIVSIVSHIIGTGQNSLLYKRLVDELCMASDVQMFVDDLFEHGVLFLFIEPIDEDAIGSIEHTVIELLNDLRRSDLTEVQIQQAMHQVHTEYLLKAESFQERAYMIARGYLATGDVDCINNFMYHQLAEVKELAQEFIKKYIRSTIMHTGAVLPLPDKEKAYAAQLQRESDRTDAVILNRKVRQSQVEPGVLVHTIDAKPPVYFDVPQHSRSLLHNGLVLLEHKKFDHKQLVEIQIDFAAKHYYDPNDLQGLGNFVFALLQEGTVHHTKERLMELLASHGMQLDIEQSSIHLTLLKQDIELGLSLLCELLEDALFTDDAIEKIRAQIVTDIESYWDTPNEFVGQLVREHVYKEHPYSKNYLGTAASVARITKEDIERYYKAYVVPNYACIVIAGDFDVILVPMIEKIFERWQQADVIPFDYPAIAASSSDEIIYPIMRDQVVLVFAGLSVNYHHPMYDALLIFDQIFTGGAYRSMSSHLFQLREQTGLFYSIGGSLLANADKQSGMFYIKTMVSQDRLVEAEAAIKQSMDQAIHKITEDDITVAKNAIVHQIIDQFETLKGTAQSFLFLERMELPQDYFADRMSDLAAITKEEVITAVQAVMCADRISVFKVGRV